jgi:hypothetical protein
MSDQPVKKDFCRCPYCDAELQEPSPFCGTCAVIMIECVHCGATVRESITICPACGDTPK